MGESFTPAVSAAPLRAHSRCIQAVFTGCVASARITNPLKASWWRVGSIVAIESLYWLRVGKSQWSDGWLSKGEGEAGDAVTQLDGRHSAEDGCQCRCRRGGQVRRRRERDTCCYADQGTKDQDEALKSPHQELGARKSKSSDDRGEGVWEM